MRLIATILTIVLLSACGNVEYKVTTGETEKTHSAADVEKAAYAFNVALVEGDTIALNELLHDKITYGHSNGWIESKQELKEDLYNGTLVYHKVDQPNLEVVLHNDMATVRGNGIFEVDYKEHEHMVFDLHVMQTWVWEDDKWQLLNRQSVGNK